MGTTLWVLGRATSAEGDDFDHSAMFDAADELDGICKQLDVAKLSGFFDWADFNANMGDGESEEPQTWFDPGQALPTLRALRDHIRANPIEGAPGLGEELDDCLGKVSELAERSEPFHLCVVM